MLAARNAAFRRGPDGVKACVLREVQGRPQRNGALSLLAGPERIEAGWWDGGDARRDYFVAIDGAGRWLWIFRDPRPPGGWFLHGWFA